MARYMECRFCKATSAPLYYCKLCLGKSHAGDFCPQHRDKHKTEVACRGDFAAYPSDNSGYRANQ